MSIFLILLFKIIPLYFIIILGFIAGKFLQVKKEPIATLLIYTITPIIIFNGVVTTKLTASALSLPILFFSLGTIICLFFFTIGKRVWKDSTKNILAFTSGAGNTGYFGLPVALALFDTHVLGLVVLSILGFILYENTVGFFIIAKGHHTTKESFTKVLTLPTIYTFILGLLINLSGVHLGSIYLEIVNNFRGAYTILGMMIIGLGLSNITSYKLDFTFIGLSFLAKFLVWPSLIFLVIWTDSITLRLYDIHLHKLLILMSIVPLAANTVTYATQLKAQPEKAALAVLLSTLFALFYIPLIMIHFL